MQVAFALRHFPISKSFRPVLLFAHDSGQGAFSAQGEEKRKDPPTATSLLSLA